MQKKGKKKPEIVTKPILIGSWHGRDAWKAAGKRLLSVLLITLLYLFTGAFMSFDSVWGRAVVCVIMVGLMAYYQYYQGMTHGENDASFSEIMYTRDAEGRKIAKHDRERCFHPLKGLFATLVGLLPIVLFTAAFACMAQPITYGLGVLPSWTGGMMAQSEFGDALRYYDVRRGLDALAVMRVVDRALVMPFINVAAALGNSVTLWVERLSPLLVLIAPLGYALGYAQGPAIRTRINTGIKMGDDKKKRRERKARRQRRQSKSPERLI